MRWVEDKEFLPEIATSLRDDDVLASIVCESGDREVVRVSWARLEPDDVMSFGTINVSGEGETQAAHNLNDRVGSALVNRAAKLGKNALEEFYDRAEVMPTWRRLSGGSNSLVEAFSIRVGDDIGFRPYTSLNPRMPAETRVRSEVETLRALRWASRVCGFRLGEVRHINPLHP